jgi:hypothetical protein
MSFPRERPHVRIGFTLLALVCRVMRWEFRPYLHPVREILAAAERRGLRPVLGHEGLVWQVAALERVP